MACDLWNDLSLACRDSIGGVKNVYLAQLEHKSTLTEATEGLISAFTLDNGEQFWKYELEHATANFVEAPTANRQNGTIFYQATLNIMLNKRDVATRNQLRLAAQNRLMIIIEDNNGTYWLMGEVNGAMMETSGGGSGTALADRNGYELVFMAEEGDMMSEVDSTLISTLTEAAS